MLEQIFFKGGGVAMDHHNEGPPDDQEAAEVKRSDYRVEDYLALVVFGALILLVFLQVVSRYVFNNSFIWSEELARYHFITLTFIGAIMAARHGSFIRIELFSSFLPSKARRRLALVVNVVELIFLTMATGLAWQMFLFMCAKKMVSVNVSMGFLYASILIGFLGITLRTIQLFVVRLRHPDQCSGK
jgi:TRAP-type C4-dicarboxylate transport system permease small subunit